jgi:hypothetical protein
VKRGEAPWGLLRPSRSDGERSLLWPPTMAGGQASENTRRATARWWCPSRAWRQRLPRAERPGRGAEAAAAMPTAPPTAT